MMKFRLLLFVMMFTGVVTNAQEGVKFEDLTFKEALAKAKAENKLVFMDFFPWNPVSPFSLDFPESGVLPDLHKYPVL